MGRLTAVATDASGRRLVTGMSDGTVTGWNLVSGFAVTRYECPEGASRVSREVSALAFCSHPTKRAAWLVAGGWRGRLTVWSDDEGDLGGPANKSAKALMGHSADVLCLAFGPSAAVGCLLASGAPRTGPNRSTRDVGLGLMLRCTWGGAKSSAASHDTSVGKPE